MNLDLLRSLVDERREEAALYRRRGQEHLAAMAESYAEELEERLDEWQMETLTVAEAAEESGYSESQLYSLLSEEKLPNVGKKGAPRVRRGDLPRKPGSGGRGSGGGPSLAEEALDRRAS